MEEETITTNCDKCDNEVEVVVESDGDEILFDDECPECGQYFSREKKQRIIEQFEDEVNFSHVVGY